MSSYRTDAVVIKTNDFGEADKILTLFTRSKGKISAIAKGVKKIQSRKAGSVDLLSYVSLFLAEGRSLDIVLEAQSVETFRALREDLIRASYAYEIAEITDQFSEERSENYQLFTLLVSALRTLNSALTKEDMVKVVSSFKLRFLGSLGFRPQLVKCVNCNQLCAPSGNRFSAHLGGIVCGSCSRVASLSRPISSEAIKVLRFFQDQDFDMIQKLVLSSPLALEVEQHIKYYLEYLLEKSLHSSDFVERVKGLT